MLAEAWLSPQARQEVTRLLGAERLPDIANWADSLRQDAGMGHVSWYHFEKMNDGITYLNHLQRLPPDQRATGGVIQAILFAQNVLENRASTDADKSVALKLLVHFIGDLHQPMHTGRADDKGGLKVPFAWFGQDLQLHKVWDSAMILSGHADLFSRLQVNADYAVPYGQYLVQRFRNLRIPEASRWSTEAWLAESINTRTGAYNLQTSDRYEKMQLEIADQRVYLAGIRIADTLNRIFAGQRSNVDLALYRQIEQIVGRLENIISFRRR